MAKNKYAYESYKTYRNRPDISKWPKYQAEFKNAEETHAISALFYVPGVEERDMRRQETWLRNFYEEVFKRVPDSADIELGPEEEVGHCFNSVEWELNHGYPYCLTVTHYCEFEGYEGDEDDEDDEDEDGEDGEWAGQWTKEEMDCFADWVRAQTGGIVCSYSF